LEAVRPGEVPRRYVQRVTRLKLLAALQRMQVRGLPRAPVLCADTTVALGDTILGKPATADDARQMLAQLSGRTHRVFTAVAVGVLQETERKLLFIKR
jgi:septum formation protein